MALQAMMKGLDDLYNEDYVVWPQYRPFGGDSTDFTKSTEGGLLLTPRYKMPLHWLPTMLDRILESTK